ncbi:hypothetical protein R3W88_000904 [Solanum pinnatisectum]|uniref:Uncharacterized protein n=1 Tax=Solanum pinnatisectum TaxID=50273 RepID=A0AAV9MIU6_9SOLN|nr:hypothetical protein R3W88_000904 [Solanum pinnatisectum]
MLKKDDADVIIKSQQQILGEAFDGKEKANIKKTVNFDDGFQAERELMSILGAPQQILVKAFDGKEEKKKVEFWEKQLQEEKAKSHQKKDREAA